MDKSKPYLDRALFVWDDSSEKFVESMVHNPFGTKVTAVSYDDFLAEPGRYVKNINHVVVSGNMPVYTTMLGLADQNNFSLAFLPLNNQHRMIRSFGLSYDIKTNIQIALQKELRAIDNVYCNGQPMLFDGYIGRTPFLKWSKRKSGIIGFFNTLGRGIKQLLKINLIPIEIETASGRIIKTAASGIFLQHWIEGLMSRFFTENTSPWDGKISAVIVSPFSIIEYIKFLFKISLPINLHKNKPKIIGHIRSSMIKIRPSRDLKVDVDDFFSTSVPLTIEVVKDAVKINAARTFWEGEKQGTGDAEYVEIDSLPDEKEIPRYINRYIPFFSYASESRVNYLFPALKEDARTTKSYVILMVASTILATIGLLLNSASVVIGAMLLAPLMTPIVSFSMGLLRNDNFLLKRSVVKILIGVSIGMLSSIALTYVVPYFKLTNEILSRVNPTILDLGVAIVSGFAAAYSKSFKEIYQSLAGVAVAVALVPPLAVSGIGICHGEFYIFFGAFLLFLTNLVGITLSATFTFQLLGFSATLKRKKSFLAIFLMFIAISFPLYLSFNQIRQNHAFAKTLKQERYLVNGKYVIISSAQISSYGDTAILNLDLTVRDELSRADFQLLKEKIQQHFNKKLHIRADINYIL